MVKPVVAVGEDPITEPATGCPAEGTIPSRIYCILSYHGSTTDVVINYLLLTINLIACVRTAVAESHGGNDTHKKTEDRVKTTKTGTINKTVRHRISAFVFVWIFQIGLCLLLADLADDAVGCAGISIVWCAMFGWLWCETTTRSSNQTQRLTILNVTAMAYYAMTEATITTVAHVCAAVMGALLEGSWRASS